MGLRIISKSSVKPVSISEESKKPYYLSPIDLLSLDYEYAQFGLLFNNPGDDRPIHIVIDQLKNSLATTLTHFFPLSGRFVTQNIQHPPSYGVYVDCKDPAGAEFVHAVASNVTISDISTPTDVPLDIVEPLFGLAPGTINNRAHTIPLLVVQVTQLVDGIFIAFSLNHALVDGTSYWQFINSYSQVCRSNLISRPPVTNPWLLNNRVHIPGFHDPTPTQPQPQPPPGAYRQRIFRFSLGAITRLKAKAKLGSHAKTMISSYRALAALIWRSTTRARGLKGDQTTTCVVPINIRSKLEPPLSDDYFGNCITSEYVSSKVDELLSNSLGWAVSKLDNQIINCDDNRVRSNLEHFISADFSAGVGDPGLLFLGSSPRLNVYGNDFGWGNPIAVRWCGDMIDGYVHVLPGRDKGSVDLMVSLLSKFMDALELDDEFMGALSFVPLSKI